MVLLVSIWGRGATGTQGAEIRDVAKHTIRHKSALRTNTYPAQGANHVKVEKPWTRKRPQVSESDSSQLQKVETNIF